DEEDDGDLFGGGAADVMDIDEDLDEDEDGPLVRPPGKRGRPKGSGKKSTPPFGGGATSTKPSAPKQTPAVTAPSAPSVSSKPVDVAPSHAVSKMAVLTSASKPEKPKSAPKSEAKPAPKAASKPASKSTPKSASKSSAKTAG